MEIKGFLERDGKFWVIDIPLLNLSTQGRTKKEVLYMAASAILDMIKDYFGNEKRKIAKINLQLCEEYKDEYDISLNDSKLLLSLILIRQREISRVPGEKIARRLGFKSPNSYFQYEKGHINVSINKYEELLKEVNPDSNYSLMIN